MSEFAIVTFVPENVELNNDINTSEGETVNSQVSNDIVPEFEYISLPVVRAIPDVKFVPDIVIES